jgi:hypothetical protein
VEVVARRVMTVMDLIERNDCWSVDVPDGEVSCLRIDWAVTLTIAGDDEVVDVRVAGACVLSASDGTEAALEPEDEPAQLAPVLRLVRLGMRRTDAFKDGRLEIEFADGSVLRVPASEDLETWEISGPRGIRLVSLPGNELAVWRAAAEA